MATTIEVAPQTGGYATLTARRFLALGAASALLLASLAVDVGTGPGNYPLSTVVEILLDRDAHGARLEVIVWDYRLPIAVTAVIVGALLGIGGR